MKTFYISSPRPPSLILSLLLTLQWPLSGAVGAAQQVDGAKGGPGEAGPASDSMPQAGDHRTSRILIAR